MGTGMVAGMAMGDERDVGGRGARMVIRAALGRGVGTSRGSSTCQGRGSEKAQANEGAGAGCILEWTSLEEDLRGRIVTELESVKLVKELESSDMQMDIWTLRAKARCEEEVLALALAGVWGWARRGARARGETIPSALADSQTIWRILTTLNHSGLARHLWHHSPETRDEYPSIVHFIAPITRLPFELLRQIFLIVFETINRQSILSIDARMQALARRSHQHLGITQSWDKNHNRCRHKPVGKE